jgi:DNA-binding CsgD family transcriptional regulator
VGAGASLTPREREIVDLMADGANNRVIASRLAISRHTVKFHVASILVKLGAKSRTEAVAVALRRGLLAV